MRWLVLAAALMVGACGGVQRPGGHAMSAAQELEVRNVLKIARAMRRSLPAPVTHDQEVMYAAADAGIATLEAELEVDWRCTGAVVLGVADVLAGVVSVLQVSGVAMDPWVGLMVPVVRAAGWGLGMLCPEVPPVVAVDAGNGA